MKTILSVMFAVMVGLTFVGSTFADEKKMDAPAGTTGAPAGGEMKQGDATKKADDAKAADKDKKKKKEAGDKEKH
jgi:hypothetical protein